MFWIECTLYKTRLKIHSGNLFGLFMNRGNFFFQMIFFNTIYFDSFMKVNCKEAYATNFAFNKKDIEYGWKIKNVETFHWMWNRNENHFYTIKTKLPTFFNYTQMLIQNKKIFSKMLSYKFALSLVITIYTKQCHERLMIEAFN